MKDEKGKEVGFFLFHPSSFLLHPLDGLTIPFGSPHILHDDGGDGSYFYIRRGRLRRADRQGRGSPAAMRRRGSADRDRLRRRGNAHAAGGAQTTLRPARGRYL